MSTRKIICLTPVKNEAWILETFLKTTSLWADHIIIADQNSTDNSSRIAKSFEKVIVVPNNSDNYNEANRQKLLIDFARKTYGAGNILIALDADEILVNFHDNPDWQILQNLSPGIGISFPWLNVLPGNRTYFDSVGGKQLFAYIDDGREHAGTEMHSCRLPVDSLTPEIFIKTVKVLHYQFSVRERQLSKHRWYECLEKIKYPDKNNIDLYRVYHHIDLPKKNVSEIPDSWSKVYSDNQINIADISDDGDHWWDKEVCMMFEQHGLKKFRKQYVWYIDWQKKAEHYFPGSGIKFADPRNALDKAVHRWLKSSQENPYGLRNRLITRFLKLIKW